MDHGTLHLMQQQQQRQLCHRGCQQSHMSWQGPIQGGKASAMAACLMARSAAMMYSCDTDEGDCNKDAQC